MKNKHPMPVDLDGEVFTKQEWLQAIKIGYYNEYDGVGYWGTKNWYYDNKWCFGPAPKFATHVAWFAK